VLLSFSFFLFVYTDFILPLLHQTVVRASARRSTAARTPGYDCSTASMLRYTSVWKVMGGCIGPWWGGGLVLLCEFVVGGGFCWFLLLCGLFVFFFVFLFFVCFVFVFF